MAALIDALPTPERTALPLEIHAATRSHHTALNRLIIARLPLCLSPHATNPTGYAEGIATFGQIYVAFEKAWEDILETNPENGRIHMLLRQLRIASLSRRTRLEADLLLLYSRPGLDSRQIWRKSDVVSRLIEGTQQRILEKPHLILSYAWVMYMALFNGGRWIRDQLMSAGPGFWKTGSSPAISQVDCLSFWGFEGAVDGEDIKTDFKTRFHVAAETLTPTERQDVIDEAVRVFESCAQLVACLDEQAAQRISNPQPVNILAPQSWSAVASSTVRGIFSSLMSSTRMLSFQRPDLASSARGGSVHSS